MQRILQSKCFPANYGFLGPCNDGERSFSTKETIQRKYTPSKQVYKPYTAVETRMQSRLGPWLPVKLI